MFKEDSLQITDFIHLPSIFIVLINRYNITYKLYAEADKFCKISHYYMSRGEKRGIKHNTTTAQVDLIGSDM